MASWGAVECDQPSTRAAKPAAGNAEDADGAGAGTADGITGSGVPTGDDEAAWISGIDRLVGSYDRSPLCSGGTECKLTQANNEAVAIPAKTSIDRGRRGIGRDVIDPWPSGDRSFGGSREADPAGCPRADVGGRLLLAENRHAIS